MKEVVEFDLAEIPPPPPENWIDGRELFTDINPDVAVKVLNGLFDRWLDEESNIGVFTRPDSSNTAIYFSKDASTLFQKTIELLGPEFTTLPLKPKEPVIKFKRFSDVKITVLEEIPNTHSETQQIEQVKRSESRRVVPSNTIIINGESIIPKGSKRRWNPLGATALRRAIARKGKKKATTPPEEFARVFESEEWRKWRSCEFSVHESFFPERGASTKPAQKICSSCAVHSECFVYSIDDKFGLWAGHSERTRRKVRKALKQKLLTWDEALDVVIREDSKELKALATEKRLKNKIAEKQQESQ